MTVILKGWLGIFKFFNKFKKEGAKEGDKSDDKSFSKNQISNNELASKPIQAPKEVPDLAMEQYPLEESFTPYEKTETEEIRKPISDVPTLDMSNFRSENNVKSESPSNISPINKPIIRPDPILLKPQEAPVTKGEEINQQRYNYSNQQIITNLDTSVNTPINPTNPTVINTINEELKKQILNDCIKEKEMQFDEKDDVEKQKRDLFFSTFKQQVEKRSKNNILIDKNQLINNMKTYQQGIMQKESDLKEKQKVDSVLADKISTLEILEEGWYMLRKEIETKQRLLLQKEKMIDEEISGLKNFMEQESVSEKTIKTLPTTQWFVLKDGKKLRSINELKEILKTIEDPTFYHHVNELKNDFSSWIRHVFEDAELADKISQAKTKEELIKVLEQH